MLAETSYDYEDDDDRDDDEYAADRRAELDEEEGCVLGERCCCPHPFHGADECFDAEMAEAYERELSKEHSDG